MEKQVARGLNTMNELIIKDDLLYHSVHGLCRVAQVSRKPETKEVSYSLLPVPANRAKIRFIIPQSSFENSGFSKLITVKEANAILEYLKTGEKKDSECSQTWMLAVMLWSEACNKEAAKDAKKRQILDRAAKGLVGAMAFVYNMTLKETAGRIRKSLGAVADINPVVLAALEHAGEE